jgi:DNA-binding response OmpR family regulator
VDDDESVRDSLKVLLALHGYQVTLARDGREALAILRKERFGLVITDLLMPNVDGIETIREIRKQDASLKILAMSGGDSATHFLHLHAAQALGADEILKKPFEEKTLLAVIRRLALV